MAGFYFTTHGALGCLSSDIKMENSKIFLRVELEVEISFISSGSAISRFFFLRSGCENLKEERGGIQGFIYNRPANGSLM